MNTVTTKIIWDRLVSIVDEASVVQYRTAFSTVVQEANDFACSLLSRSGDTLASSRFGLPSFVATQAFTTKHILEHFGIEDMGPGDVFLTNDPWVASGHSMDLTVIAPVHRDSRVIAFAGSVAHAVDLGGAQRWNTSTDIFEDALVLPPLKLVDAGQVNETLVAILRANTRFPDLVTGDLDSQLAAIRLVSHRVEELLDEYGLQDLDEIATEILDRSESAARAAIADLPDGVYTGEVVSDPFPDPLREECDGAEPIRLHAAIEIKSDELRVDFSGSSLQRGGSFNSVWTYTTAYGLYALRLALVPGFPHNAGFDRPISIHCPAGTIVNAEHPASTLSRHSIGHQVPDVIYAALSAVSPSTICAQSGSAPCWDVLLMSPQTTDGRFHRLVIVNGGTGGGPDADGITAAFPANISNTPIEILETTLPLLCEAKALIPDSAGAGRWRGGFGQRIVLRARAAIRYAVINARTVHPAQGVLGGCAGSPGKVVDASGIRPAGSDGLLAVAEKLILDTPGGGGFGALRDRAPELLEREMREELVTAAWACGSNRSLSG